MLRIILAYRGHSTRENPEVLYAGHDGEAAQEAVDSAPSAFTRFSAVHAPTELKAKPSALKPVSVQPPKSKKSKKSDKSE